MRKLTDGNWERKLLYKEELEAGLDAIGCEKSQRDKDTWSCPCPGHNNDDVHPSLYVGEDNLGFPIVKCRSQDHRIGDVVKILRRELGDDHPIFSGDYTPPPKAAPAPVVNNIPTEDEIEARAAVLSGSLAEQIAEEVRHLTSKSLYPCQVGACFHDPETEIIASATLPRLSIPIRDKDGELINVVAIDPAKGERIAKVRSCSNAPRGLFPPPEAYEGGALLLVEGELDALSAIELGFQAVSIPGAQNWQSEWRDRFKHFSQIAIMLDCDDAGRTGSYKVYKDLAFMADIKIIDLDPSRSDGYDLNDFLIETDETEAFETLTDKIHETTAKTLLATESFKDIVKEKVTTLRHGVPFGKLTLVAGDPGLGKSLLTVKWAADASAHGQPVLMISGEDGAADTVKPRLEAAKATLRDVHTLSLDATLTFPDSVTDLEQTIRALGIKLVVIDPLNSFMSSAVDSFNDASLRTALTPLSKMAERTGCAIVIVMHLNKDTRQMSLYRIAGSIGYVGAVRSVFVFARDPDDAPNGDDRILAHIKYNLGKMSTSERWRILEEHIDGDDIPHLNLVGVSPHFAHEILKARDV